MRGEARRGGFIWQLCSIPGRGGENLWARGHIQPLLRHLRRGQIPPRETQKRKAMRFVSKEQL